METLEHFYDFMDRLSTVRRTIVAHVAAGTATGYHAESLRSALSAIDELPGDGVRKNLSAGGRPVTVTIDYERVELEKDVRFLEQAGTSDTFLEPYTAGFEAKVSEAVRFLDGRRYRAFVTDRDGTVNNYCGRYRSSHQSIYNAIYLSRFTTNRCDRPVILTSAPLSDHGLLHLSVMPEQSVHYAGSKGREYYSARGVRGRKPIPTEQDQLLSALNERITELISQDEYRIYGLIGSAVQFKFGQTTVSRQDIHGSVADEESRRFLEAVTSVVRDLDPDESQLRIEDTGLDIEIILTVDGGRDFNKGDGIRFLDDELGLDLAAGPTLICGDTASDVPMVEAAASAAGADRTYTVFVNAGEELRERISRTGAATHFVDTPDVLVAALGRLGVDSGA